MKRIGIHDARTKFSELIERVSAGSGSGAAVRRKSAAVKRIERMREEFNILGADIRKLIERGRR